MEKGYTTCFSGSAIIRLFQVQDLLIRHETVFGGGHQLAFARLTLMMLLTMAGMAIFLVPA
jgi:hypothetical protein